MNIPNDAPVPPGWIEALEESEAQIARGETVPLEPLLTELHALADRIEARLQARQARSAPIEPR